MERVIVTTGGTGGHIFPALAVAEELRRRNPGVMLLFMGGKYGQEADLAVNAGLDFVGLPVRGVMGRGLRGMGAALGMARALSSAAGVMRKMRPQAVIGFGGYAAFAGVLAGRLSGALTAVHEQNAFPGMSNRLLGRVVDRIFLSMPDSRGVFPPARCRLVGNPVRTGILALYEQKARSGKAGGAGKRSGEAGAPHPFSPAEARQGTVPCPERPVDPESPPRAPRLLIMGGSQGARALNDGMIAALDRLLGAGVEIRHQTGQADHERIRAAYRAAGAEQARVEPFIVDMPKAYAWADLVFCRAGASTLAELTAAGLPALLAPFPQAAQDHQRYNARYLAEEGAAVLLEQERFLRDPALLARELLALLQDRKRLALMSARSLAQAKPHAARDLTDELETLLAARRQAGGGTGRSA